jgi:hypothetical protein
VRLIRPARNTREQRWALALSLGMLLVGAIAIALMALLPSDRPDGVAILGVAASLAIGVGLAWLIRAISGHGRDPEGDDLARLLSPAFDDNYALVLSPRLPGVPADLAALLVGPAGVRALIARRWRGRYRVRGRAWEYDTRRRTMGWIPCRTNPSFDAAAVADAVSAWARTAIDESSVPIIPTIAFPRAWSLIVLEEPDGEVVTADNAPWWAQSIGRLQRMDAARVARFVQSVMDASDGAEARAPATQSHSVG